LLLASAMEWKGSTLVQLKMLQGSLLVSDIR
jgi:hypothetical protein